MTDIETWKPTPGYEGKYEVSSRGKVKSLERFNSRGYRIGERMLSPIEAVETIAGMQWEYAAHAPDMEDMPRSWLAWGCMTYQKSRAVWVTHPDILTTLDGWKDHFVIARRLVSEPEEME